MKTFYITIAAFLLGFTLLNAQSVKVYPSDDMTINTGSSGMAPSDEELWIANWTAMQNFHQTLIKFDLTPYFGQTITSAKLNLFQFFHAPDGTPTPSKLYAITENWDEATWLVNASIAYGDNEYATPRFTSALDWYEINITDLVNDWLNDNIENYGLVIIADPNTKFAEFYSKDADDQSMHPFLEIEGITATNDMNAYVDDISVFPNPMCQNANIEFNLLSNQQVNISIVNSVGMQVLQLCNKQFAAGMHIETLSCGSLRTGVYYLRLQTNGGVLTRKIFIK